MKKNSKTTLLLLSVLILVTLLGSGLFMRVTAQTPPDPYPYPLCKEIGPYPTNLAGWLTIAYQCVYMPLMQNSLAP